MQWPKCHFKVFCALAANNLRVTRWCRWRLSARSCERTRRRSSVCSWPGSLQKALQIASDTKRAQLVICVRLDLSPRVLQIMHVCEFQGLCPYRTAGRSASLAVAWFRSAHPCHSVLPQYKHAKLRKPSSQWQAPHYYGDAFCSLDQYQSWKTVQSNTSRIHFQSHSCAATLKSAKALTSFCRLPGVWNDNLLMQNYVDSERAWKTRVELSIHIITSSWSHTEHNAPVAQIRRCQKPSVHLLICSLT